MIIVFYNISVFIVFLSDKCSFGEPTPNIWVVVLAIIKIG